tara:strand:- start:90 stop:479 length:390 start_codon:yes stop_codon:yes gene_type:complete
MIIKLKDILEEADITIRNPHTHKTIKAQSALSSDDPNLVKKARKALGMDDKDKKNNDDEKGSIFKKNNEKDSDKLDRDDKIVMSDLLKIKKHSEKLISLLPSKDKLDPQIEKKINTISKNIIDIYKELV